MRSRQLLQTSCSLLTAFILFLTASVACAEEGVEAAPTSKLTGISLESAVRVADPEQIKTVMASLEEALQESGGKRPSPELLVWPGKGAEAADLLTGISEGLKAGGYTVEAQRVEGGGTEAQILTAQQGDRAVLGFWMVDSPNVIMIWGQLVKASQPVEKPAPEAKPSRPEANPVVLAKGDPDLTQKMVDDFNHFIAWLLEAPLTQEQKGQVRDGLVAGWKRGDKGEIQGVLESLQVREQVWQMKEEERALVRKQVQPEFLKELRAKAGDESARWLLGIYDSAHKPLAAGSPPLTRQMTDAYAEVTFFMLGEAAGQTLAPDAATKEAFAKSLAAGWPKTEKAGRDTLARMLLLWAAIRVAWPQMPEDQKAAYRAQWRQEFQGALAASAGNVPSTNPLNVRNGGVPAPQKTASVAAGGKKVSDAEFRAMMRKVQSQHNTYMMMSNMSWQMHYSRMNAINAMGGSPYRYVNQYGVPY